jgi:tRNA A-37 threonylcarbamoyl transferase component Bud32
MSLIEEKEPRDTPVSGSGWSRLETLPDDVIEQLKRRQYSVGHTIGERYRLKALLGMGAMGQVFVAENMAIGVEVAVKLLKAELIASKEFRQRFQKEAEAVGSISHQNVARFLDLVVGDPTFLVMEFVNGPTLQQVLEEEKRLAYDRALTIAVRLCWGLHAAHERGIVHRDMKPANIILASDPEIGEQPKIIDFGLAKLATATEKAELTRTGQIVGTPEYMAPEQIEGKKVDARSDVYSLGCVLYKMLVGRTPFNGEDDVQVLYRQLHEPPQPPSMLVPGIPPAIDAVLARALAKSPADRYADTRELAHALNQAHDRRRAKAVDLSTAASAAKVPIALAAATTLVVGAIVGVLLGRKRTVDPVVAKAAAAPADARVEGGELLIVATEPPGATVEIDGTALADTTPAVKRGVTVGKHTVKITRKGYGIVERTVAVAAGERAMVDVRLPPKTRQIRVRTIPTGAKVYLENALIASSTPADISVQADEFYAVRVEKLGFEPLTKNITPDDTATELELRLDEEKQPMGYLWIETNGVGNVWIDGRFSGFTAPALGLRVPAGKHVVELRDSSGARSNPLTVKLVQGESLHVTLDISGRK